MAESSLATYQRHLRLLREASTRLGALTDFTHKHMNLWSAEEAAEYKRLRNAWKKAAADLSEFEPDIKLNKISGGPTLESGARVDPQYGKDNPPTALD